MRGLLVSITAVLAVLALPGSALAKPDAEDNKLGRFGIGHDSSLAGVGGLSARFQVAKNFGLQGIFSLNHVSFDTNNGAADVSASQTLLGISLRGDIAMFVSKKSQLQAIIGFTFANEAVSPETLDPNPDESENRLAFETGLRVEHFFTDFFSVHTEVGFVFALVNRLGETGSILGEPDTKGPPGGKAIPVNDGPIAIFGVGDVLGTAGFTFWF